MACSAAGQRNSASRPGIEIQIRDATLRGRYLRRMMANRYGYKEACNHSWSGRIEKFRLPTCERSPTLDLIRECIASKDVRTQGGRSICERGNQEPHGRTNEGGDRPFP